MRIFILWIYVFTGLQGQMTDKFSIIIEGDSIPNNYSGIITDQYPNGKPKVWRNFENGVPDGKWIEWYPSGVMRYKADWKAGKGEGNWEYYFENGQLRYEGVFMADVPVGIHFTYHENGVLATKEIYLKGKLHGEIMSWDENGILKNVKLYQEGIEVLYRPQLFMKDIISSVGNQEWDLTFTSDESEIYFTRRIEGNVKQKIYVSQKDGNGHWGKPIVAPFSIDTDEGPFLADDNTLYFSSYRAIPGAIMENEMDMNIWVVKRNDGVWGIPEPLPFNKVMGKDTPWPVSYESAPSTDNDGNLLFWTAGKNNRSNLFSIPINQLNGTPKVISPPSDDRYYDAWPVISPDGRYLFFGSDYREDGFGGSDIYYSIRKDGEWSLPINAGPYINSSGNEGFPRFSPDGKYFYFSSDKGGNEDFDIYYMESRFINNQ